MEVEAGCCCCCSRVPGCEASRLSRLLSRPALAPYTGELQQLFQIAWPITLSAVLLQLIVMVSIVFCGHLGKEQLDAAALASTIITTCGLTICLGLSFAFDTLLTQAYGSNSKKSVGIILQKGLWILLLACLPCWAVFLNTRTILLLLGQTPRIAQLGQDYVVMVIPGLPGYALFLCLSKYLQSQSVVYPTMIIGAVGNALNAAIHAVFLFVLGMGVRGAGLAVSLSYWSLAIGHLLYIRVSRCYENTWPGFRLYESLRTWGAFLRLAIPGLFMLCLEWWGFEIMIVVAGLLGPTQLGAQAVLYQFTELMFMIPLGVSLAASVRVGNHLGEGKPEEARVAARTVMGMQWTIGIATAILLLSLRTVLPGLFTQDRDVAALIGRLIPLIALFHLTDATQGAASGILRGIGLQRYGAIVNVIGFYVIGIPLAVPLMLKTSLRVAGAWCGVLVSTLFQSVCFLTRIAITDWLAESKQAVARVEQQGETKSIAAEDYTRLAQAEPDSSLPSAGEGTSEGGEGTPDAGEKTPDAGEATPRGGDGTSGVPGGADWRLLLLKRLLALVAMVTILLAGVLINHFSSISETSEGVPKPGKLNPEANQTVDDCRLPG